MQSLAANGVRAERGLFSPGTTPAQPADPGRKPGDHGTERGRELAIKNAQRALALALAATNLSLAP